jgi:hypothetical protein
MNRYTKNIGMLLLEIFLVVWGLISIFGGGVLGIILGILAIAAGIFLFIGR